MGFGPKQKAARAYGVQIPSPARPTATWQNGSGDRSRRNALICRLQRNTLVLPRSTESADVLHYDSCSAAIRPASSPGGSAETAS